MAQGSPPRGPGGPVDLNALPAGWFGMFEPRPYKNITELLGMMANVLLTAEKSNNQDIYDRYLSLFDIMYKGLALFIDQEFYAKSKLSDPIIIPVPNSVGEKGEYSTFGEEIPENPDDSTPVA